MLQNNKQLIVFIKSPQPGKCKTRLIPFMSAEQASEFYKELVIICLDKAATLEKTDIAIYIYPDINHPYIKALGARYPVSLNMQAGSDLGERMHHAIQQSLQHYEKCVLIGTDCPVLDTPYLDEAFKALDQHDMVLGPAKDGGYVLIGATKIEPCLFSNIKWGTNTVLQQSLDNNEAAAYKTHLLNTLWDIDTPEDYIKYQSLIE